MRLFYYLFLLLFFISACQYEDQSTLIELEEEQILETTETNNPETEEPTINSLLETETETEKFVRYMQWVSFISAHVLKHQDAREEIKALLIFNPEQVIKLEEILIEESDFKRRFINLLEFFILIIDDLGKPGYAEDPGGIGGGSSNLDELSENVQAFLSYILEENCIELFFPNGFNDDTAPNFNITSTAHPLLEDAVSNDGYLLKFGLSGESGINIALVRVDESYLNDYDNIIVARPFRETELTEGNTCWYDEYSEIDFRLFLNF